MQIEYMRECVVLAETLSFTETAKRLYSTQSAISKHILIVEQDLGVKLFLRDQKGVRLTKAGRMFVEDAASIINSYNKSLSALERLSSGIDSTLNIGYLAGASFKLLPDAVSVFLRRFPGIDVQPATMEIDGIVESLRSNEIDMGITTEFVKSPTSLFSTAALYEDHLSVIIPKNHRLAKKESVNVWDLVGEKILMPNDSFMVRESPLIKSILSPIIDKISIKQGVNDIISLFLLMNTGCYVTIMFDHIRHFDDFESHFLFLPLENSGATFDVVAVWKKSMETDAILAMVDILKQTIAQKGGY